MNIYNKLYNQENPWSDIRFFLLHNFILWLPVLLWAMVIFSFSSIPTAHVSEIHWKDFIVKKSAHITEYAIFTVLLYRALLGSGVSRSKSFFYAFIVSICYAISDEFHQSFTPGREPTLRDVGFDTIGASLAILSLWKLLPQLPPKLKIWVNKQLWIY
jgi:VanZ family protein